MRTSLRRTALTVLAACLVAGCGTDSDADDSDAIRDAVDGRGGSATETVEVSLRDFMIDPDGIQVSGPGVIEFDVTNDGDTTHAFEVEGNGIEEETDDLEPGESAVLTVELDDGTYEVYCPVGDHEDRGMVGTLVVGDGGATGGTEGGTTTDDDDATTGTTTGGGDDDDGADDSDRSGSNSGPG